MSYDDIWKDKLISYDGKTITYDVFGCPIDYMGTAMTWDIYGGLTSVDNGTDDISYTYMGDGQRRTKTVNGTTTTYHYNNGMLLSETTGDVTLRYYYDSTGKVATIVYKKGDGEERSYFYTRNAQGDIIGIYRSSDSALIGTYEYDLWGRPVLTREAERGIDTDGILTKNPFRYRGYYYDNETGFYYLNARYYDPQIRRFISADSMNVLMIATTSVNCKNLFSYSENNPVNGKDSNGGVVETVFDVISLAGSIVDVCCNPADPWAWAGLAGDAVDLIPFATGVGEAVKGARAIAKAADKADDAIDAAKAVDSVTDTAQVVSKGSAVPIAGCFVAGTRIKTEDGSKNIEEIKVGDLVYAKDAETDEKGYKEVVQLFQVEATELIHLRIGDEIIDTTPEHPFWVDGYGFKRAGELETGDYVENADGDLLLITSIQKEYLTEPITVYNFEVEDWHTYYVSDEAVFVHNMCAVHNGLTNSLSDDAIVVRGGTNKAAQFANGSGVTVDSNGVLQGLSVNCKDGLTIREISEGIPHNQIGVTTVRKVRELGGNVVSSSTKHNPMHATLFGITPAQAENLFNPTILNPSK